MKKIYLIILMAIFTISVKAASYTVSIVGTSYSPATLTVNVGDVVTIQGSGFHPLAQVDQTTWNANGTATLTGGWGVTTSNQTFTVSNTNTIYFVCTAHVSMGMKGQIVVNSSNGIKEFSQDKIELNIYPNPSVEAVTIDYILTSESNVKIEMFSITGDLIAVIADEKRDGGANKQKVVLPSNVKPGLYFISIKTNGQLIARKQLMVK